jgi:hypothetical protein
MDAVDRAHAGADDRMRRLERRISRLDRPQLLEDCQEAAVVRLTPVAACSFALLDDVLDRLPGARRVGDGDELRPVECLGGRLCLARADEQLLFADLVGQVLDPCLDRAIEMADGVELLAPGDDVGRPHDRQCRPGGVEAVGVGELHPFGSLEEQEVAERSLAERDEGELHPSRVALGLVRHVRTRHVRGGAHRREDVVDEPPVQHLLGRHLQHYRTPLSHGLEVLGRERLVRAGSSS